MRKSKTKWKRVLSVLLVTAMVLTGNAFSGMEVKAAEVTDETVAALMEETAEAVSEEAVEGTEAAVKESGVGEEAAQNEKSVESTNDSESIIQNDSISNDAVGSGEGDEIAIDTVEGEYGTLQNGDFEDADWKIDPWEATHSSITGVTSQIKEPGENNLSRYYDIWIGEVTEESVPIKLSQTITNVAGGNYKITLKSAGSVANDTLSIYAKTGSTTLTEKKLGILSGWTTWGSIETEEFEVTEGSSVTIEISGTMGKGEGLKLDDITFSQGGETVSFGELKALAESQEITDINTKGKDAYTEDSWNAFQTALDKVNALITNNSDVAETETVEGGTAAYKELQNTIKSLFLIGLEFDLYVKYDRALTLSLWNADKLTGTDLTAVDGRNGWYYSKIIIKDSELSGNNTTKGFGFEIKADGVTDSVFNTWEEEAFTTMLSKADSAYCMKQVDGNWTIEAGTGMMDTVSFDIYSADAIPYLVWQEAEETKNQAAVPDSTAWYKVTDFTVPETGFSLHSGSADGELLATFTKDGAIDGGEVSESLFNGYSFYLYKAGTEGNVISRLYKDKSEVLAAVGMTLDDLKEKVDEASEYLKATGTYTSESLAALQSAVEAANALITAGSASAEDILAAYTAIEKAVSELIKTGISITLHYYAEDAGKKPVFYYWGEENISTTANIIVEKLWANDETSQAYEMTAIPDYKGWYSIDISFSNPSASSGFNLYLYDNETKNVDADNAIYKCDAGNNEEIYAKLISGEADSYAVKGGNLYIGDDITTIQRNVTLYVYDDTSVPVIMSEKTELSYVNESTGEVQKLTADDYNDGNTNYYYSMTADAESKNWYYLTFSVPVVEPGSKAFQLYKKTGSGETAAYQWEMNFINGGEENDWSKDLTPIFSGKIYYKNGEFSEEKGKASSLEKLIAEAEKYQQADYEEAGWTVFAKALADAKAVVAKDDPTAEEIEAATKALTEAIAALVYKNKADVNVQKVFLDDDFITGADLSSYVSLAESGVVFKDENGNPLSDEEFFKAVAAGGTNWVRIRLWENPYDSNGNGYGGGNNDIDKAITLAKLADGAGMKVLLDFHYSDFWVDPSKYAAPKAWANMTIDEKEKALYDHTYTSLEKIHNAGVDVGMVQVGNETNSGIAGETDKAKMARLFNSGSKAVRDFSEKYLGDRNKVMVAVHFTDPQDGFATIAKSLHDNNVDYDVFASSYYPYWHENNKEAGNTGSLVEALEYVATTYGKKVMVAETSWATTWEDGDGHDNSAPKTSGQNLQYDISVQGQVDEMRAVVAAVNSVTNGIGVFYWEPAWIPVGYAYNDDGTINQEQLKANKELWEKYGSGWASSYSAEYDPNDAGKWYGGSAVDNQSWFDFDGTALASLNAYRYMRSGTTAGLSISYVPKNVETTAFVGEPVNYPETVQAKFNNGTTKDYPVVWDSEQAALVTTDKVGEYYVEGMATCTYENADGKTVTEKYAVTLTIKVQPLASSNQLKNAGFETVVNDAADGWTIKYVTKAENGTETESITAPAGAEYTVKPTTENPYSGQYGMNFYRGDAGISIRVCQEITGLDAGTYDFGGYVQGGSTGGDDLSYSYVKVFSVGENGERILETSYKSSCALSGWLNWSKPEVSGFALQEGQVIEVGFEINSSVAGSWGSIDDAYLYGSYGVNVDPELENGVITLSDTVARVGEKVRFTVLPNDGYVLDDVDVSLYRLGGEDNKAKLPVTDCGLEVKDAQGSFIMPGYPVYVTAKMKSIEEIAGADPDHKGIKLDDVTITPVKAQIYTGRDIKPSITAVYKTYTLVENKDYTLTYANNKEIGTAKITVEGKGNFIGTKELSFEIKKATNLKDAEITISGGDSVDKKGIQCFLYTGDKIEADVKVEVTGTASGTKVALTEGEDYILSYVNNTKVGTATLYIVANENNAVYSGSVKKTFKIVKPDLGELDKNGAITVTPPSGATYTGKAVKPNITIKYGSMTLRKGVDYTVSYSKNKTVTYDTQNPEQVVAAGVLTVKGKGSFTGKFTREFKISPKSLKDANITATAKAMTYKNGSKITPSVSVTAGDTKLKLNRDFKITAYEKWNAEKENGGGYETIEASQITEMGTYRLTLTGQKNYQGEIYVDFRVVDAAHNIANAKIKVKAKDFTGKAVNLTPGTTEDAELLVYFDLGSPLAYGEDKDYTIEYENNIKAGKKAKVTIIGQNDYAGEKISFFTINAVDISKLAEGTFSAQIIPDDTLGAVQYYTGYALKPEYMVKADLPEGSGADAAKNTVTLIKGTDYTISFSNNVSGKKQMDGKYLATVKIKGKGNFKGTYTDTFEVTPTKLSDFNVSVNTVTYNGKAQKPPITFIHKATGKTFDLKPGTAYTAVYKNTTNIGNPNSKLAPYVTIKEKGLNPDVTKAEKQSLDPIYFSITSAKIDASCVADIKIQNFSGKAVKPALTIKVNGRKLKLNKDYTVKFENNTLRGKASVTITGIGNYAGTVEKKFVIK